MAVGYPFKPKKPKSGHPKMGGFKGPRHASRRGPSMGHHKPRRSSMHKHALKGGY